jgi:cellulose biosynthesis protein BcsQ
MLTAQAASWTWPEHRPVVVLDLDPQGDASGWATRAGVPSRTPGSPEEAADLIRSLGPDHTVLVNCFPGRLRDQRMAGVGVVLADALLLPSASGRPELDALGRAIRALDELAERGAALKAGVILNHFRETTRNRVVEEGLRLAKLPLLGRLSERAAFSEAFADGRSLVHLGGAAAHEAKTLWSRIESWLQSA